MSLTCKAERGLEKYAGRPASQSANLKDAGRPASRQSVYEEADNSERHETWRARNETFLRLNVIFTEKVVEGGELVDFAAR